MNYQKIYNDICIRGQQRLPEENKYYENHHVVPRCLDGSDDNSNITTLTPREHFICHLILAFKLYPTNYKLAHAIFSMSHQQGKKQKRYIPNGRLYEIIRNHSIELMKQHKKENPPAGDKNGMYGKEHTKESKEKMQTARKRKGRTLPAGFRHSKESKKKMSETRKNRFISGEITRRVGFKQTEQTKTKQKETRRNNLLLGITKPYKTGWTHSEETKKKWKLNRKGTQIGSNNHNARKVKCNETNMEFGCVSDAAIYYNITGYLVRSRIRKGLLSYA